MEIGDYQSSCNPGEYFDGVEDKCIPCENVCMKEPLTFCMNNCPEFYKKLTSATFRSVVKMSRTTSVDHSFLTSSPTEPSPNDTPSSLSPTQVIPLTTLLALTAAVIAILIAVVAFILICKARRTEHFGVKSHDTENPLLPRTDGDSLCQSKSSTSSSNDDSLYAENKPRNSKASLVCNSADPPDVARDADAGDDKRMSGNTSTANSNSNSRSHFLKNGKVFAEASEQATQCSTAATEAKDSDRLTEQRLFVGQQKLKQSLSCGI